MEDLDFESWTYSDSDGRFGTMGSWETTTMSNYARTRNNEMLCVAVARVMFVDVVIVRVLEAAHCDKELRIQRSRGLRKATEQCRDDHGVPCFRRLCNAQE